MSYDPIQLRALAARIHDLSSLAVRKVDLLAMLDDLAAKDAEIARLMEANTRQDELIQLRDARYADLFEDVVNKEIANATLTEQLRLARDFLDEVEWLPTDRYDDGSPLERCPFCRGDKLEGGHLKCRFVAFRDLASKPATEGGGK